MAMPFFLFWILLGAGWYLEALNWRSVITFIAVYLVASTSILFLTPNGVWLVGLTVLLDIILVLKLFGGDIRIR